MNARINWRQIPWETVSEKISRKLVNGQNLMMILYLFQPHQEWPTETHGTNH